MDGVQLPQSLSHFEEAVFFLALGSQKFLVLILSTWEEWKAESNLPPPSGFEHGTHALGIQYLKHSTIAPFMGSVQYIQTRHLLTLVTQIDLVLQV